MTPSDPTGYALRAVRPDDAPAVLAAFVSAPDMSRQGDVHDAGSAAEHVAWLCADGARSTAIADADDVLVGLVGIRVDIVNRLGWTFYWLHAAHRGHGLVGRAAAAVAERALASEAHGGWGLERLELGHRANNPASGAVARAAGFVREGREREKFLVDGERIDVLTYGRLRTDPAPPTPPLPWRER